MTFGLTKSMTSLALFYLLCHSEVLLAQNSFKPCVNQATGLRVSATIAKVTANKPSTNENIAKEASTIDRQPTFTVVLSEPIDKFCSVAIFDDKSKEELKGQWTNTSPTSQTFKPKEALTLGNHGIRVALKSIDGVVINLNKLAWNLNIADSQTITIADTPTSEYEFRRLLVFLYLPDYFPTGLEANTGSKLVIYLNTTNNSPESNAKLRIGTPGIGGDNDIQIESLKNGANFVDVKISGLIYISYTKTAPPFGSQKADFTIAQGFNRVPYYRLGVTTQLDWKKQLSTYPNAKNVVLESDKAMLVYLRETAVKYQNDDQDLVLKTYDSIIQAEDDLMGLDNSYPNGETNKLTKDLNRSRLNKFLIVQTRRGPNNLFAGDDYVGVHYELDSTHIEDYAVQMFTSAIKVRVWGAAHEIGHQHQQRWMKWIGIGGEVTENIYALAVKRSVKGDMQLDNANLSTVKKYLNDTNPKEFSKLGTFESLYMYHQLWLAYGNDFYIKFHQLARQNPPEFYISSSDNLQFFILNASKISGEDLTDFFRKWGWYANANTVSQINQMGLQKPRKDIANLFD